MTSIVVLTLVGVASYAFVAGLIDWKEYTIAVLPIATGLAGYWLKDRRA
jgi:hypothetical protein